MRLYKISSLILAGTLAFSPLSVYAAENGAETETTTETTTETPDLNTSVNTFNATNNANTMTLSEFTNMVDINSSSFQKLNNDDVYQMMKNSLDAGESVKLTEAFAMSEGLEIPNNMMYDLSDCGMDGTVDASSINLEYASLLTQMDTNYDTAMEDLSSFSVSTTDLFNNTYGDLVKDMQISEATLPSNFSFENLTTQNTTSMDNTYKNILNSSDYTTIKNNVSLGNVFQQAANGPSKYGLMSGEDMETLLGDYSADAESNYKTKKSASKTWHSNQSYTWQKGIEADSDAERDKDEIDKDIEDVDNNFEAMKHYVTTGELDVGDSSSSDDGDDVSNPTDAAQTTITVNGKDVTNKILNDPDSVHHRT